MYYLADFKTKKPVQPENLVFTGEHGPWEVVMDMNHIRSRINPEYFRKSPPYVSKYLPFMPIRDYSRFVSLGEGATPLIQSHALSKELGTDLYFKLENQNPTGSFKDRGSAVEITIAREFGARGIALASTGNMAASCSCYAAAAHIPCFVFVPEGTQPSKLAQVISFGGKIVQVKGTYSDAAILAEKVARSLGFYLAGDYAFRIEGHKTAAYELIEQLFFQVPDYVVIPMGCGTNIASYLKGFKEYYELGLIDRIPQLIGVQAEGACPIVNSFASQLKEVKPVPSVSTIARAIAIDRPLDGEKALEALYQTNGQAVAVSDREMLEAQYRLSKEEGLFVETSCASTIAALERLAKESSFANKKIVCILTGAGLKDPDPILKIAIKPPTIYPNLDDFLSLYRKSFFEGRTVSFVEKDEILFDSLPSRDKASETMQKFFGGSYSDSYLDGIVEICGRFLKKGKPISFSDFQDIIQDAFETVAKKDWTFSVEDFEVQTGRNRKAKASVVVSIEGKEITASGEGVGPVDAVINALKTACGTKIEFSLSGYKVDIRSQGTDAVVFVELKLKRGNQLSEGTGTSPDIIQASIEAFEEAYNGFYSGIV